MFDRTGARMTFRGFAGLGRNYGDGQARFARQQLLRCRFGFLNCRTLRSSLDDLSDGSVATNILHKVELYKSHMQQYKLYALALSEVRLDFQGSHIYEDGFTIIASGVGARGGTALLLSPGATSAWQLAGSRSVGHPSGRVCSCTLALGGKEGTVKLISAYSPTFRAPDGDIDSFWAAVRAETSSSGMVVVLGDCNARVGCRPRVVGARAADDQDSVLGFHGIGACNEMGQRMLDFCQTEHLRITNTFFPHSVANKASWYHLGSRNPGLLDYALVRTVDAAFVTNCRHYPNIDVDSDHVLGILDMRQRPCARTSRMTAPAPPAERLL